MARDMHRSEAETTASKHRAEQDVDQSSPAHEVGERLGRLRAAIERVRVEDAELLDRLSR